MSECTCANRGFCPVLGVAVTEQMRQLCIRDHDRAVVMAQSLKANRAKDKSERQSRVERAVERKRQLISWLKFFRHPKDRGIGDTAFRLVHQKKKSPIWVASDAHDAIRRLMAHCSCSKTEAVRRLNREYPY